METAVFLGVAALIFIITTRAISNARQIKAEESRRLGEFGFTEVKEPVDKLAERVSRLHRRERKNIQLVNVYRHNSPVGEIYIFGIRSGHPKSSSQKTAGVIAPGLDLPRFSLYPRIDLGGLIGKALNKLLQAIAGRDMSCIHLENNREFEEKYILFGRDIEAVRQTFSGDLQQRLLEKNYLFQMEASGDTFIFAGFDPKNHKLNRRLDRQYLKNAVDDARMFIRTFRKSIDIRETVCPDQS
jgi:hypothetical protein